MLKMAMPSDGFVPEQSSSRMTKVPGSSCSKSCRTRTSSVPSRPSRWSAGAPSTSDTKSVGALVIRPLAAGTNIPFCAKSCERAMACKKRVLPPEFGPVISVSESCPTDETSQAVGRIPCSSKSGLKSPFSSKGPAASPSSGVGVISGRQTASPSLWARSRKPSAAR